MTGVSTGTSERETRSKTNLDTVDENAQSSGCDVSRESLRITVEERVEQCDRFRAGLVSHESIRVVSLVPVRGETDRDPRRSDLDGGS